MCPCGFLLYKSLPLLGRLEFHKFYVIVPAQRVSVTYPKLHEEVSPGQEILIDDGLVAIRVQEIRGGDIVCHVENGGTLSANKSINIPGAHIQLPALTEKDVADIRFGVENDFDFIAASFVRRAADVEAVRQVLHECGGGNVKNIAKIRPPGPRWGTCPRRSRRRA